MISHEGFSLINPGGVPTDLARSLVVRSLTAEVTQLERGHARPELLRRTPLGAKKARAATTCNRWAIGALLPLRMTPGVIALQGAMTCL